MDKNEQLKSLERATKFLAAQQKPNGSWPGENYAGPAYTALCLCVEATTGILSEHDKNEGYKYCLGSQLDDGSYPDYPSATKGSINTTALVYAALKIIGTNDQIPAQLLALSFIQQQGGFEEVSYEYKIYLVMAGLCDAQKLPSTNILFFKLIPGSQRLLGSKFGLAITLTSSMLPLVINGLKNGPGINKWRNPIKSLASYQSLRYLLKIQNPEGNWAGILVPTLWAMLCMYYMEVPRTHPSWIKAHEYLQHWKTYNDKGMRVSPYKAEIWNTALSIRALLLSNTNTDRDIIQKGLDYLIANQSTLAEPPEWQNPAQGAPSTGGWPYEQDNPLCPDCDTTAAVLWTLSEAKKKGYLISQNSLDSGLNWLMHMQNKDGGWAAFTHGLQSKPPGPIFKKELKLKAPSIYEMTRLFLSPPVTMGDPATAGLTGRVLSGLGAMGKTTKETPVVNAIEFIKYQTSSNDAWWGRWEVNFLASTRCVISGLCAVGESPKQEYIQKAANWMVSKQNPDGGWGESIESYANPELAGQGPSCGPITGNVLSVLMDTGNLSETSLKKGFKYLCDCQNEDGSWTEIYPLYVMFPPNLFYKNFIYSQYSPIEALAKYCSHKLD